MRRTPRAQRSAPVPRPKKVSQTQLARELGISQALVSLVLNGRKAGINAETYERVWSHATKRGYHPKGMHLPASPAAQPRQVAVILRAPLRLRGTLSDPQVSIETARLAGRLGLAGLLALINPLAGLLPLLDSGDTPAAARDAAGCRRLNQRLAGPAKRPVAKGLSGMGSGRR